MKISNRPGGVSRIAKRALDLAVIFVTAPITIPVGLLTATLVTVGVGRPVLYRQERAGLHGRIFTIFKFRSMTDARREDGALLNDADRLPTVGKFIRRTSLDEIPQLLNVVRGEMSLVGPRPLFSRYLPFYSEQEARRHEVRPGITGLAQTAGRNGLGWEERLRLDVEYVDRWSMHLDFAILARTIAQTLKRSGVAVVASDSGEPLDVLRSYPATDRLGLRGFLIRDIRERVAWMNHPETRRHMRLPAAVTEESTLEWYRAIAKDPNRHDLVVYDIETGEPRVMLGLKQTKTEQFPELYIFVDPRSTGEGLGTQALGLLFRWLHSSAVYEGCRLSVDASNERAARLYRKFGFESESGLELDSRRLDMYLSVDKWSAAR